MGLHPHNNDFNKALKDFNAALEIDPNNEIALLNRGVAFAKTNRLARALKDFKETFRLNPENKGVLLNIAGAFYLLGNFTQALKTYDAFLKTNPEDKSVLQLKALTLLDRGAFYFDNNELSNALRDFNDSLKLNPNIPDPYISIAYYYFKKRAYEQAINYFDKAIEINSNNESALEGKKLVFTAINIEKNDPNAKISLDVPLSKGNRITFE